MPENTVELSFSFPPWLSKYQERINEEILSLYDSGTISDLEKAAKEAIAGGKRIRAVLTLLWCEAISGEYRAAAPLAVAYEIAHAAALVEDDVIDSSDSRRGEKSIVGKYGVPGAILTSNTLLFHVPKMISEFARRSGAPSETLSRLLDLFGQCFKSATFGEFLDLQMAERERVTVEDYEEMIRLKTGALIGASSASGAVIGGGVEEVIDAAYRFGEALGMAYQVQDDLLDLMGEEDMLGKPVFTDLKSGKKNAALIHLLGHCSAEESSFIRGLSGRNGKNKQWEVERTRELLTKYDSARYSRDLASRYIENAKDSLSLLHESAARERLGELAMYLAFRNY